MEDAKDTADEKEIVKAMIDSISNENLISYLRKYISLAKQSWDNVSESL